MMTIRRFLTFGVAISLPAVAATPYLVKDINPTVTPYGSSSPMLLVSTSAGAFFAASTRKEGKELWITDGTDAGTRLVKDIRPGWQGSLGESPAAAATASGVLIFAADNLTRGRSSD